MTDNPMDPPEGQTELDLSSLCLHICGLPDGGVGYLLILHNPAGITPTERHRCQVAGAISGEVCLAEYGGWANAVKALWQMYNPGAVLYHAGGEWL
jgi:hypothetical protein